MKANLQVGMYARAIAEYKSVSEGDLGICKQTNSGRLPAKFAWGISGRPQAWPGISGRPQAWPWISETPQAQFAWDGMSGDTCWVYCHEVVILPNPYKTRHEFSSDQDYGRYIKANLRLGMQVRARVD